MSNPSPKSKISTLPQGEGKCIWPVGLGDKLDVLRKGESILNSRCGSSLAPLWEREEFQVEQWRNFEIRERGRFMSRQHVISRKSREMVVYDFR